VKRRGQARHSLSDVSSSRLPRAVLELKLAESRRKRDASPLGVQPSEFRVRLNAWVVRYPQLPFVAPFFAFLVLMAIGGRFGQDYLPVSYAVRTFACLGLFILFLPYYPPFGKPHWVLAIVAGLATTVMWIGVHHAVCGLAWYPNSQLMGPDPAPKDYYIPSERLWQGWHLWSFYVVRIGGAATVVPMIEEIFWRGFLLRWLIDQDRFEEVPLGRFTWSSFLICSLLSAAEHPQWEVGILCWLFWNALFCWKKSLLFLMITHGITNLTLYVYVVAAKDWILW
jgi:CAAX protease family protein